MKSHTHKFKFIYFPKDHDLALVILLTLLCIPFVLIPPLNETPIRIILGLPLVLFLPGYSLVALLFPAKDSLGWFERIALSFGLSIATVPLLGLALNYTPFGIRLSPVLIALSLFTVSLALCAYLRRCKPPEEDRFVVDFNDFKDFLSAQVFFCKKKKCIDKILSVILVISIALAISMTVYLVAMPKQGEKFTEFYILGPNGTASDYPTNLTVGEEGKVIIGIVNHEYADVTYQLEARLNGEVIDERSIDLMHNERWESPFSFRATKAGKDQKLEFLLYKDGVKDAYRTLHLWMDVS